MTISIPFSHDFQLPILYLTEKDNITKADYSSFESLRAGLTPLSLPKFQRPIYTVTHISITACSHLTTYNLRIQTLNFVGYGKSPISLFFFSSFSFFHLLFFILTFKEGENPEFAPESIEGGFNNVLPLNMYLMHVFFYKNGNM